MNHSYHLKTKNYFAADLMLCINVILFILNYCIRMTQSRGTLQISTALYRIKKIKLPLSISSKIVQLGAIKDYNWNVAGSNPSSLLFFFQQSSLVCLHLTAEDPQSKWAKNKISILNMVEMFPPLLFYYSVYILVWDKGLILRVSQNCLNRQGPALSTVRLYFDMKYS